jgi:hypothetical protein
MLFSIDEIFNRVSRKGVYHIFEFISSWTEKKLR